MSFFSDMLDMFESHYSNAIKVSKPVVPYEREAHRAVAMFLCYVGLPPKVVEQIYFKELIFELNCFLRIKTNIIEQQYLEIYDEEKSKIKEFFRNFDGQISLSVEMIDYEYMCLTAHFVDENWKLKSWVLHYRSVRATGVDCLAEAVVRCLSELNIASKISTLTMKACNYYEEVFQTVIDHIQKRKNLQLNGRLFNVICCADIFSSMVQDAFEKIDRIIQKLRLLVFWGRSLPVWDITLGHLEDALKLEAMGEYSKNEYSNVDYEIPSTKEWKKVRGVYKLVQSIYEAAYVMFETKHSTANVYLHLLQEIQATLTQESSSSDKFIRNLAKEMLKEFNKYWKDMFLVLAIATVLDPRFKMKYIEFSSSKCKGTDNKSQSAMVLEAIHSLYEDYVIHIPKDKEEKFASDSSSSDSEEESPRHAEEQACKYYNGFTLFQEFNQLMQSANHSAKSELDQYLEEPVLPWKQDFSALIWWRDACSRYPTLSRMARDILAIPLSLAASFEAYYTQPRTADPRIKHMKPELMNALMCTQSWLQGR